MSYITAPTYTAPNRVTCMPGFASDSECKLAVITLFDPTTDVVSVVVNGVTYVSGTDFTLTARGTDAGVGFPDQACWSGLLTVTGLSPFTRYTWTVSQTVSGTNYTDNGSLLSAARKTDKFVTGFAGCDNNTTLTNQNNNNPFTVPGFWQHYAAYMQDSTNPELAAIPFVDDLGYASSKNVQDTGWSTTGATELVATGVPYTTLKEYDYCLAYMACIGMLGPDTLSEADLGITGFLIIAWGRETNRTYCRKNANILPQFGDWEFMNDMGWDAPVTDYPNPRFVSAGVDGVGKTAWDAFYGLMQPPAPAGATDAVANHWVCEIGSLTIATFDAISNSSTTGTIAYNPPTAITTMLGTAQIVDILTEIQTYNNPFTLLGMSNSVRYLGAGPDYSESSYGAQHPIYNHCLAEFQRLFTQTGQNPPSLMNHRCTNGVNGTLLLAQADHHWGQVVHWKKAAYTDNNEENFYTLQVGTTNGSSNFNSLEGVVGETVADGEVLYQQEYQAEPLGSNQFHGLFLTVDGSTRSAHASLNDWNNNVKFSRTFYVGRGNSGYADGVEPAYAGRMESAEALL